jgi:uncharacterized RDD family membrane protein YckC
MLAGNNVENQESIIVDNQYAAFQKRIYAFLFDLGLAILTSIGPYFIFDGNDMHVDFVYIVCIFFFLVNMFTYMQSSGERSPGDNIFRIRVVRLDTLKGSKFASSMRVLIILIMGLNIYVDPILGTILLILLLGTTLINPDQKKKKRMFWDIITKTVVIEIKEYA